MTPQADELATRLDLIEVSMPEDRATLVACHEYVRVLQRIDDSLRGG